MRFIASKTDEAVLDPREGYFPFSVIADAFEKGKEKGEEIFKEKMREHFVVSVSKSLEAIKEMLTFLDQNNFSIDKLFINPSINQTSALLVVSSSLNTNNEFVSKAYSKASELQLKYFDEFKVNIHIDFIAENDGLNEKMLKHDGFEFSFDLKNSQ
jgi:hypothetical protein